MTTTSQQLSTPSQDQGYMMAASTSGLYVLTGMASRIPMMSTVRRSVRAISRSRRASSTSSLYPDSLASSGSSTPIFSRPSTPQELIMTTKSLEAQIESPIATNTPGWTFKGGVDWETAKTGISIWHDAVRRMDTLDAKRLRQMHIDAIKYMHNALPTDLSETECAVLYESLLPPRCSKQAITATKENRSSLLLNNHAIGSNFVRSTTARLVCWLISLLIFAIPMLMTLLNKGLQYEREHQVSKRVVENGAGIAKAASAASLDIGERMLRWKDTEIGASCGASLAWTFQSLLEGVNDGIQSSRSEYYVKSING